MRNISPSELVKLLNEGLNGRAQFSAQKTWLRVELESGGVCRFYGSDNEKNWVLYGATGHPREYELQGSNHHIRVHLREGESAEFSEEHRILYIPLDFAPTAELEIEGIENIVF